MSAAHTRLDDAYVRPRYPVDEPPTYRAQCSCEWTGPERYRGITDIDWQEHVRNPNPPAPRRALMSTSQGKLPARTVRVPDELWAAVTERAAERGESVSDVVRRALARYARRK